MSLGRIREVEIRARVAPRVPRFRIRPATLRDLDVLVRHRRRMWEDMGERDRVELDAADTVYRRWARQRMKTKRLVGFILEDAKGRAVASGCIWLQPIQPHPGRTTTLRPYLLSMFTEPEYRDRGLATRIVREAVRWCKEHGYARLTLHASREGRGLYQRLGFARTWEMRIKILYRSEPRSRRRHEATQMVRPVDRDTPTRS